jgi:glycosyltransferase involved in cell wall biosynthesis
MQHNQPVLVILTPGFPENETDSTCLPAQQNFIKAVNKNYPAVKIIIISFQYPFVKRIYQWQGNPVYAFGGKNKSGLYRRLVWHRVQQQLKTIRQQYGINGMLSFWCDECAFIAHRFAKKYSIRHCCWLLGQDAKPGNRYLKKVDNSATDFIALSDFIYQEFEKNYTVRPLATVPLGINKENFAVAEKTRDIDLMAAGSLIPLKQFGIVLQVAAALKKNVPGITVLLCGDGPEIEKLKTLAADLAIAANVQFAGALPHKQVLEQMQRSKIFLHPSSYEGLGMVCAEALYAGAQVISFCRPIHKDIKNWHIVNSAAAMQTVAEKLLTNLPAAEKVLFYSSEDSARAVMQLFGWAAAD